MTALREAYNRLETWFADNEVDAYQEFGWSKVSQEVTGNRVCWVPGDASDNVGDVTYNFPASNTSPPTLAVQGVLVTLYITGVPEADSDEFDQVDATKDFRDDVHAGLDAVLGTANFKFVAERWDRRNYGLESNQCIMMTIAIADYIQAPVDSGVTEVIRGADIKEFFPEEPEREYHVIGQP